MERDLQYEIKCPALLICGTKDHAGSCIRYNKAWHRNSALQAGKTSREIENAIRKIRMAIKKYEAAPEDERDYNSIRVAVGELEKLGCAV